MGEKHEKRDPRFPRRITKRDLEAFLNTRRPMCFDYLIDVEKEIYVHDLMDYVTDIIEKDGRIYAVGRDINPQLTLHAHEPWYELERIYRRDLAPPERSEISKD